MVDEKSPFYSLTRILANKRRKLVKSPVYNSYFRRYQYVLVRGGPLVTSTAATAASPAER